MRGPKESEKTYSKAKPNSLALTNQIRDPIELLIMMLAELLQKGCHFRQPLWLTLGQVGRLAHVIG